MMFLPRGCSTTIDSAGGLPSQMAQMPTMMRIITALEAIANLSVQKLRIST
jgi:hypothetical protein